ncbi:MAG TPA: hypothetical protein VIB98_05605 [Gemmatimonadaceae bacterium]|jgi:hypothetical protein
MTKHRTRKSEPRTPPTGAGTEAAEGMKAVSGTRGEEPTRSKSGKVSPPAKPSSEKLAHPGTQPLEQRHAEHESGYGGKKDEPRVSSDQREKVADDGSLRSESRKR